LFFNHGTQFQINERKKNRAKSPAPCLAWNHTVNITCKQMVRLKQRFNLPGIRMHHCHIPEHEEQGMMGTFDVI